jgi:hypothetical protein
MSEGTGTTLWWCRSCGMVWAADEAPICRHNIPPDIHYPARMMEPLPTYHPFHPEANYAF